MNEYNFKIILNYTFAIRMKYEGQFSVIFFKDRFNAALLLFEIFYVSERLSLVGLTLIQYKC